MDRPKYAVKGQEHELMRKMLWLSAAQLTESGASKEEVASIAETGSTPAMSRRFYSIQYRRYDTNGGDSDWVVHPHNSGYPTLASAEQARDSCARQLPSVSWRVVRQTYAYQLQTENMG